MSKDTLALGGWYLLAAVVVLVLLTKLDGIPTPQATREAASSLCTSVCHGPPFRVEYTSAGTLHSCVCFPTKATP